MTNNINRSTRFSVIAALALAGLGASPAALAQSCDAAAFANNGILGSSLLMTDSVSIVSATWCGGTTEIAAEAGLESTATLVGSTTETESGATVELGSFQDGSELVFYLFVPDTGETYFTGTADRNSDGMVHAAIEDLLDGTFRVGFEDTLGGGDMDFDDVNLIVTANAQLQVLVDTDGDGAWDFADVCPLDAANDTDGDSACDSDDVCPFDAANDSDGDGVCDSDDVCPVDMANDTDGDGVCDSGDVCPLDVSDDSDADGACDSVDVCPLDFANDADIDGLCADVDPCPADAANDVDGDGICGSIDNCPAMANIDQLDTDGDGLGDVCQVPVLHVDAAVPAKAGKANSWMVTGAAPSAPLELLFGKLGGTTPIAGCPGLSIDITSPRLLAFGSADMAGTTALTFAVPMAARGKTMAVQAVDLSTCTVSNVEATRMR